MQIDPRKLPPAGRRRAALYRRLGGVIGETPRQIAAEVRRQRVRVPYAPATIRSDVSRDVYAYLFERHINAWQRLAAEAERRRRMSERDRAIEDLDRGEPA